LQERGLRWERVAGDEGAALQAACCRVTPEVPFQGAHWHVLHTCAQVQARLDWWLRQVEEQTAVVARQAAQLAAGVQQPTPAYPSRR
jgi:hypothetical protein